MDIVKGSEDMKRRLEKPIAVFFLLTFLILGSCFFACAEENSDSNDEIIDRLYHDAGADELIYHIPEGSRNFLEKIKFDDFRPEGSDKITPDSFFGGIIYVIKENITEPLRVLFCITGIVLLSAMFETLKTSSLSGSLNSTLSVVSALCMAAVIMPPMLSLIETLTQTIVNSSDFMMIYIPVITVLIMTSGQPVSGTMYYGVMIYISNAILQIASKIIIPLLKCIISMSVVTSVSEKVSLGGPVNLFKKTIKWILTFCMSLFVAFMTMKSIVSVSEDSLSNKAVKFAISNFVPLVGGALSDAYQTVVSCVSVLKSGVGVAAMFAVFAIFLPAVLKCMMWQFVISAGVSVSDIFGIGKASSLLSSLGAVISTISAMLLCTMVIYIISTAIIIIVGG